MAAPLFSIVTPVYNTPDGVLREMLDSVLAQTFPDWELILVDDKSPNDQVLRTLHEYAAKDARIVVVERPENGHIVKASNDGVKAAKGEFIALLDHDDLLTPDALARNASAIEDHDDVDYLYSDEDKIDPKGKRFAPFRKPRWSPERLRGQNYCTHFSVARTSLVREIGGFREGLDGSQDHDLILRVTERARRIVHIPEILYHWRVIPGSAAGDAEAKPYAREAGRRAVTDHLASAGLPAEVTLGLPGSYAIKRTLSPGRRVSLVIASDFRTGLVWGRERVFVVEAVRSALLRTDYPDLEVVVAHPEGVPAERLDELQELAGDRLVLVPIRGQVGVARTLNLAVLASTGDRVVVLADDLEFRSDLWLDDLVAPMEEDTVGVTGGKLFSANTTIRHAGYALAGRGFHEPYRGVVGSTHGYHGELLINREASGVSAACLGIRREVFLSAGGFSEEVDEAFIDLDLCLKAGRLGMRTLFIASCHAYYFDSKELTPGRLREVNRQVRQRWGLAATDPYMPAFVPRAPKPLAGTRALVKVDAGLIP